MMLKRHRNLTMLAVAFAGLLTDGCKRHPAPAAAREPAPMPTTTAAAAAPAHAPCPEGRECSLERWMDGVLSHLDINTPAALSRAFRDLAAVDPPGYPNWRSLAEAGAAAAERGEPAAVKRVCDGCHEQYRPKFRAEEPKRSVNLPIDYSRATSTQL